MRSLYAQLLDDRAHHPDTMDERRGAWGRLLALFRARPSRRQHAAGSAAAAGGCSTRRSFRSCKARRRPAIRPRRRRCRTAASSASSTLLITVDGEKLSYRTLDVEQIGSVYETVMGFTIETRPGPAVAIKAGKNDRTPVFVDVAALAATKGSERAKFLKEEAGRNALSDKVAQGAARRRRTRPAS